MSIKALQDYTYVSKYARFNAKHKRRETWSEAVDRVKEMHLRKYPGVAEEIEWAFEQVRQKRVLGSQRALQFGGSPIEKKNARIFNCIASHCDRIRMFQETFWLLLCGCGTGFSVQKHHIAKLPSFFAHFTGIFHGFGKKKFVIPDTIEGWADALGVLLATYMPHEEFADWDGFEVEFDYSQIRKAGSVLASGVGKAPGAAPLERSLEIIRTLLNRLVSEGRTHLRPIDAYDIVMHASDAVLSGGVRRSATICLFSPDDEEMATAKTGNWFLDNPQRARSNNSALLLRDSTTKEEFERLMKSVKEFGEPGFVWADDTEYVVNPCVEVGFYPVEEGTKKTGWQACNLSEINGRKIKTKEDFAIAAKAAAIIGTLQAGYTNLEYLGQTSINIIEREALLGVSITGMMDNPDVIFDPAIQTEMAKLVVATNVEMAKKIGIRPAARATCVKPSGTTSCILGTASGIHPHHAKRYFRRVQGNNMEAPLQYFKNVNPLAAEKSVWSANKTDEVITFCIEVPDGAKVKNQLSAITHLEYVRDTQQHWVESGRTAELCTKPWLTNNVSNTINVRLDEWDDVTNYIYKNRKHFAGIALLPASGDLDYPQAPMCTVFTPREIVGMYGDGSLFASGLIVDGLRAFDNNLWAACETLLGLGKPMVETDNKWAEKMDFIRRAQQFATRHFDFDLRKMTYCLKCVHNWHLWCSLTREYKEVDYSQMIEEHDETRPMDTVACAGGKCESSY